MGFYLFDVDSYSQLFLPFALAAFLSLAAWTLYLRFFHPLAKVPGPFFASITRLWYVIQMRKGSFDTVNRALHEKYGPVVRIAPSEVSIDDPEAVNTIYGVKSKFTKTDFYPAWRANEFKTQHADQFTDMDEAHHASRRRLLNTSYSMSSVLESESYIDKMTASFLAKLDGFASSEQPCDLGQWLQMYAFDVLGELFFGSAIGFIETSSDFGGWIQTLDELLPFIVTVAVLPKIFRPFFVIGGLFHGHVRKGIANMSRIAQNAKSRVLERQELILTGSGPDTPRRDILSKLFEIKDQKGEKEEFDIPDIQLESHVSLFAGSDTTAIAMRAVLYYLMLHPSVEEKLLTELSTARQKGDVSSPVKYSEAIKLPYFTACVKEAMRLHPSVGLQLPRHPPPEGCEIAGYFFPTGVRVGINPAVIHYNRDAFGSDAGEFKPERWLTDGAAGMDRYLLTFGGGSRTCIGKNISLAEIHKLIPELLFRFKITLANPNRPVKTLNYWFTKQEGLIVNLVRRR